MKQIKAELPQGAESVSTSVTRALDILELLVVHAAPMSVADIGKELGINRATVYNLINSLIAKGYVSRLDSGKCGITSRVFEMGVVYQNSFPVVHLIKRANLSFADMTPNTLKLSVMTCDCKAIILYSRTTEGTPEVLPIGFSLPLHTSATGKVLMAYAPEKLVDSYLSKAKFKRYTAATITDPEVYRQELVRTRETGLGFDREEFSENMYCIAAPVLGKNNRIAAAVSISGKPEDIESKRAALQDGLLALARDLSISQGAPVQFTDML